MASSGTRSALVVANSAPTAWYANLDGVELIITEKTSSEAVPKQPIGKPATNSFYTSSTWATSFGGPSSAAGASTSAPAGVDTTMSGGITMAQRMQEVEDRISTKLHAKVDGPMQALLAQMTSTQKTNDEFQKNLLAELAAQKVVNENVANTLAAAGNQMGSFQAALEALQSAVKKRPAGGDDTGAAASKAQAIGQA